MPAADAILGHISQGHPPEREDVRALLSLSDPREIETLLAAARQVRQRYFGNRIFLYGFLYFSTFCRNNCRFCQYRRDNTSLSRYRKGGAETLAIAREMAGMPIHLLDLTMGEDPLLYNSWEARAAEFIDLVAAIREETGLPVMVSPGALPGAVLADLAATGAEWYACYQETFNPALFRELRPGQSFDGRLATKNLARDLGMHVEEGILTGVGETMDDLADALLEMAVSDADQVRVMTFVPQPGIPLAGVRLRPAAPEPVIIAVMRLLMPDRLIPASLDIDGLAGLDSRLAAGANVVTSIVPPDLGLAGVANAALDIDASRRSITQVSAVLAACGLDIASAGSYRTWMRERQEAAVPT